MITSVDFFKLYDIETGFAPNQFSALCQIDSDYQMLIGACAVQHLRDHPLGSHSM